MPVKYKSIPKRSIRIQLPDTTQCYGYSCGAVAFQAISGYFGRGLENEWKLIKELKMDPRVGTNPGQLEKLAKRLGYLTKRIQPMKLPELRKLLRQKKPVMMMLQAWKEKSVSRTYGHDWKDGHWVVAIGYDRTGIYFEDPALSAIRGYMPNDELEKRWHDVGAHNRRVSFYGLAIWKPNIKKPAYYNRARHIA